MADYTIRVESDSSTAHKDIDSIDRKLKNLQAPIKVNIQFPSFSETIQGIQDVGKALQVTYGIARNVVPALMDIESIGAALGNTFQTAAKAALLLGQASPGKTLAVSLQGAVLASDTLISSIARLGFTVFGITQSVNVLKAAYGGMFDETIGREIRLQQVMLQTQTTIAATNKVLRNGVELTNPLDSVLALKRPIQKAIEEIRVESLEIAGTTSEAIIQVFGTVSSQIGQVGGSIEDAKKLALSFSAALGTIGMSDPGLAVQEVGSMLRGDIDNNSILARSLGITNKEIQKAKQTGELVDFITKKLAAFTAGQKIQAQGFAGITSNIQEIQQEMARALGAPMLQPLLDGLSEVYRRMSLVVKPAMQIADGMGRAGAAIGQGLVGGAMAAPSLQNLDDGSQKQMFESVNRATADLFLLVQQEIDKMRPAIAKFTDEMIKAFVMVGSGLKELFEGFANFKFEQLKILVNSFTNVAKVLNATVIPAVSTLLTLYGKLIEQPMFQYLSQLTAQFAVLEKIGVNGMIRIGMTIPTVISSLMGLKRGLDTVVAAVAAGFTRVGTWISTAIAAIAQAISFSIGKVIDLGVLIAATVLRVGAVIAQTIDTAFVNLAAFFARIFPQFPKLEILILNVAATFRAIGRGANQAATDVEVQAIKMALALEKLKVTAADVGNAARKGAEGVGNSVKGLASSVGGFIGTQLLGMLKFLGIMVLVQLAVTVAVDLFARFQRRNDEIASQTRTELALKRLSTVYKDVGDSSSYAAKKGKELEEAQVNTRWDELTKKIQEVNKAINDLNYDMATRGINSWQEFGMSVMAALAGMPGGDWSSMQKEEMEKLLTEQTNAKEEQNRIANQKDQKEQEASIQILGQKKIDISKQIKDLERSHENAMFQLKQQSLQKAADIISLEGDIRIQAAERLNAKLLEGQEGVRRSVTQGINEYLETKMKGEKTIEDSRRQMQIEINSMERSITDYRFETEKNIASIRKLIGNYDKEVADYKVKQAEMEGKAREGGGSSAVDGSGPAGSPSSVISPTLTKLAETTTLKKTDVGLCVTAVLETMRLNGIANPQGTGDDKGNNPRGAAVQLIRSGWKTLPGYGTETNLVSPYGRVQGNSMSKDEWQKAVAAGAVPSGALLYSTRHENMNTTADRSRGNDLAIIRDGGRKLFNGPTTNGSDVYHGAGQRFMVLIPPDSQITSKTDQIGPSRNSQRTLGQRETLGGRPVTWNGQDWIGEDGKVKGGGSSLQQLAQSAGFSPERARIMAAIGMAESSGNPRAHNPNASTGDNSYGIWQINMLGKMGADRRRSMGLRSNEELFNPTVNAKAAKSIYDEQGFSAWSVYNSGAYKKYLGSGSMTAPGVSSGQGTPSGKPAVSPPTAPVMPDLTALQNAQTSAQEKITKSMEVQMKKVEDLKAELIKVQTKTAFENILKNALPTQGTEQYIVELDNAKIALDNFKKIASKVYDPKELELTIDGVQRLAALEKGRADALLSIEAKRNDKGGKLTEAERLDLTKQLNTWYDKENIALDKNLRKRKEILAITSEYARIEKVQADVRDVGSNLEKSKISMASKFSGLQLNPEDFKGQRLLGAEETIANYRLDYKKAFPGTPDSKVDEDIAAFAAATRSAAQELAVLDKAFKKQADAWAKGSEIAKEFSGGFGNIFKTITKNGDLGEATNSFTQSLTDKVVGQFSDMAFKPMEDNMTKMFAKFFGADVSNPTVDNTTATRENTAALLANAANNIVAGPQAFSSTPSLPTSLPTSLSTFSPETAFSTALPAFSPETAPKTAFSSALPTSLATFSPETAFSPDTSTALEGVTKNLKELTPAATQANSGLQTVLGGITTLATGAVGIFSSISTIGKGGTYNTLTGLAGIFGSIGGILGGGGTKGLGGLFGGLFGGGRATGGPVLSGHSYIVGEKGPELFSPSGSGSILPADATAEMFQGTRAALAPMGAPSPPSPTPPSGGDLNIKFESTSIGGVNYVTEEQFQKGMRQAAHQGRDLAYSGMHGDPRIRKALGLG